MKSVLKIILEWVLGVILASFSFAILYPALTVTNDPYQTSVTTILFLILGILFALYPCWLIYSLAIKIIRRR